MAQAGESTLSNDMMLGTPQYISPEQARGERNLDEGTDIYSFGVVLYEMVVGKVPFTADTPFSIIHDHIYKPLPLPHSINPRVPEVVERVLLKALAKERVDRYQSVDEMVEAFGRAVRGQAHHEPAAAPSPPPSPRHRRRSSPMSRSLTGPTTTSRLSTTPGTWSGARPRPSGFTAPIASSAAPNRLCSSNEANTVRSPILPIPIPPHPRLSTCPSLIGVSDGSKAFGPTASQPAA